MGMPKQSAWVMVPSVQVLLGLGFLGCGLPPYHRRIIPSRSTWYFLGIFSFSLTLAPSPERCRLIRRRSDGIGRYRHGILWSCPCGVNERLTGHVVPGPGQDLLQFDGRRDVDRSIPPLGSARGSPHPWLGYPGAAGSLPVTALPGCTPVAARSGSAAAQGNAPRPAPSPAPRPSAP